MVGVFNALSQKRAALIKRKAALKAEYDRQIRETDAELNAINKAVEVINSSVQGYLCPNCNGHGIVRICDAAGDMENETCSECRGTGIKI